MMTIDVGTYLVISLMFAVFAAVAAVGTSLVLGVGFERLRNGFEVVRKQTAFFSDAIHKLDLKTDELGQITRTLETRTSILDAKTDALEAVQNQIVEEMRTRGEHHLNAGKAESLVRHAEDLLVRATHTARQVQQVSAEDDMPATHEGFFRPLAERSGTQPSFQIPKTLSAHVLLGGDEANHIRFV